MARLGSKDRTWLEEEFGARANFSPMPHMLPDVVPLAVPSMIDFLRADVRLPERPVRLPERWYDCLS